MNQLIINLPVTDVNNSQKFFESIGFAFNKELTDENAVCFSISDTIVLALLPQEHFQSAINNNDVADAMNTNEMLLSIGFESFEEVDVMFTKAITANAKEIGKPTNFGSIYGATFADLDGHQWNLYCMSGK